MELYRQHSSNPKINAQRNLCGRTHYVDEETLRWHKSRVLSTRITDHGLLFAIVTSDALDIHNARRGYRFVIFDLFGTVLRRPALDEAYKNSTQATKAMWAALNAIDAVTITLQAIEESRENYTKELDALIDTVRTVEKSVAA